MTIRLFDTYTKAAYIAKNLAVNYKKTILFGRCDTGFFVDDTTELAAEEAERIRHEEYYGYEEPEQEYDGYEESRKEFLEEMTDYNDSMARSEEDGWFYDN